jgi:alginate O-acetyltransferase complex protein AlgI
VVSWLFTFAFINITWIFFRAETISDGFFLLRRILLLDFGPVAAEITSVFQLVEIVNPVQWIADVNLNQSFPNLLTVLAYTGTFVAMVVLPNAYERMKGFKCGAVDMLVASFLLIWCIFSLAGVSTFLYFNF